MMQSEAGIMTNTFPSVIRRTGRKIINRREWTSVWVNVVTNAMSFQTSATFSDLKIIKKEKVGEETVAAFNESVNRIYGFKMKATKMYKVTFSMEMNMEGAEVSKQNTGFITRYVYKCGTRWYFFADTLVSVDLGLE
jgi:hypothetical protein